MDKSTENMRTFNHALKFPVGTYIPSYSHAFKNVKPPPLPPHTLQKKILEGLNICN